MRLLRTRFPLIRPLTKLARPMTHWHITRSMANLHHRIGPVAQLDVTHADFRLRLLNLGRVARPVRSHRGRNIDWWFCFILWFGFYVSDVYGFDNFLRLKFGNILKWVNLCIHERIFLVGSILSLRYLQKNWTLERLFNKFLRNLITLALLLQFERSIIFWLRWPLLFIIWNFLHSPLINIFRVGHVRLSRVA